MNPLKSDNHYEDYINEKPLDSLQAGLLILVTQYTLEPCQCTGNAIRQRLQELCEHTEMIFFPEQHLVYSKMLKLWNAKTYKKPTMPDSIRH